MSNKALTWAFGLAIKPSWVKFVLVAMADVASEEGVCFPSIAHLAEATSEDRKTVIGAISKLEVMGIVRDTGERRGRTGQVKVYHLDLEHKGTVPGTVETVPPQVPLEEKSTVQTVPQTEQFRLETVPSATPKSPVQHPKESRRRYTEPLEPSRTYESTTQASTPRKARFLTEIPADWKEDATLIAYARQQGCPNPGDTFERFRLHHGSKGTKHKNWTMAAQLWCRNEKNFSSRGPVPPPNGRRLPPELM